MIRFFLVLNLLVGSVNFTIAQSIDSENLMTIGGETISVKEFLRVYNKNIDLVQDESQKNIDYYLNLYTNYKLKLKEARTLGFDKKDSYKKEFESYKNQLSKAYTTDKEVTETLVKEAYNRTTSEVKAHHILVRIQPGQDTLAAYEKIKALRSRMVKEDFTSLRTALHDGKSVFVEDLGYFSAFKMVYDFENAAFNTPLGQTSKPFRTQFGYHVVKVLDKRPSKGKVQVAHIMIANNQKDSTLVPENRIKEIFRSIQEGDSFESLAKQFSDDKSSAAKGGVMNPFKSGDIRSEIFVNTAFGLKEIGAISEPIQSQFGWHILKLISKTPVEPYEQIKVDLEQKVKRDARSKVIRQKMLEKLKQQYTISQPSLESVVAKIQKNDADDTWEVEASMEPQVFLKIESQELSYRDFLDLLNKNKRSFKASTGKSKFISNQYALFLGNNLFQYKKNNLINENEDYANVLKEYEEGLLLFDIMENKIWKGAQLDSIGLKSYYNENTSKFKSNSKITATIARSNKKKKLKAVKKMWSQGFSTDAISQKLNERDQALIFSSGDFEIDSPLIPKNMVFNKGISEIYSLDDNYVLLNISNIETPQILSFEDAKGAVISKYQSVLESKWLETLRNKYPIVINEKILSDLKKSIKTE
ncbi:MAG: peptidylprolyl isomerase [Flavobacteriaceae bacterium]|nr:peptidylprolyl isomerase [Flavobacteriaceae bacterium]|tara:strand:+ start:2564 stop:4495 length:1932 start_codon:yes stop_codon:yes gene_type:complete